ncbi:hypothetical protein TNCV_2109521 [Trichonephila clavipes]|nr:hypothetical protein TNCV_2109521 [Trichonephila clavipes]
MLQRVSEDQVKCVYGCFARVREGRESVSDNSLNRRPATSIEYENIEKVRKLIAEDRQITVQMIADELQINPESI